MVFQYFSWNSPPVIEGAAFSSYQLVSLPMKTKDISPVNPTVIGVICTNWTLSWGHHLVVLDLFIGPIGLHWMAGWLPCNRSGGLQMGKSSPAAGKVGSQEATESGQLFCPSLAEKNRSYIYILINNDNILLILADFSFLFEQFVCWWPDLMSSILCCPPRENLTLSFAVCMKEVNLRKPRQTSLDIPQRYGFNMWLEHSCRKLCLDWEVTSSCALWTWTPLIMTNQ